MGLQERYFIYYHREWLKAGPHWQLPAKAEGIDLVLQILAKARHFQNGKEVQSET